VKLLRSGKPGFVFELQLPEHGLLLKSLELYPLVPMSHHRLNREQEEITPDENQRLLEESLNEQRRDNRKQVKALLEKPGRLRQGKEGIELRVTAPEIEMLLQVLNDVRVGSWLALGEPEPGDEPELTKENARYLLTMDACGFFQSHFLAALGVRESPDWME